jgi:hypothetical protein
MRVFKKPNLNNNWKCIICNTNEEKEVVLIGIAGTEDGGNIEAEQVHLSCLNLTYYKESSVIAQRV